MRTMKNATSVSPLFLALGCAAALILGIFLGFSFADKAPEGSFASPQLSPGGQTSGSDLNVSKGSETMAISTDMIVGELDDAAAAEVGVQLMALDAFLRKSQTNPLAAAQEALSMSNDLDRISKLALMLAQASSEDMPAIAELISSESHGFERMQQMGMLYYAWGQVDAPSAVAHAEAEGGRHAGMAVATALSSWASLDPAAARAWVEASEDPNRYQTGLLLGWSEANPMAALQYLGQQGTEANLINRWTAPQFARNLVGQRGVLALDDIAAMPASRNRNELLERLAGELSEIDLLAATRRLDSIDDPEVLSATVPDFAQELARKDPQAALQFASKYEDNPDLYARAMAEAIEEWAEKDPYEAGLYLNEQPASPALDRAVAEYSREAARVDPDAAMTFAISVQDDGLRADTIRRVAQDWSRSSPDGYAAWAEANPEIAPSAEQLQQRGQRRW